MDIHKNARLTFIRREQLAQHVLLQRMTLQAAATAFNVCARHRRQVDPPLSAGRFCWFARSLLAAASLSTSHRGRAGAACRTLASTMLHLSAALVLTRTTS